MECVEKALKSSVVRPELAFKLTQQPACMDDMCMGNGQSGVSGDDFSIDDLLDFTNGGIGEGLFQEEDEEDEDKGCGSLSPRGELTENDNSNLTTTTFSVKDEFPSVPATELTVPADDLADLEWLSHFVEDSFSEYSAPFPHGTLTEKAQNQTENPPEPETPLQIKSCLKTPFPAKARSKRARTGGRVWSMGSPSLTESSSSSSSSSSSLDPEASGSAQPTPHRCSHCGVQKTPQWRTGPLGAKTLCNACGVRYKSGRLLPEYRPACSPTFSSEIHSNHHRKVLEMRRKKEVTRPESGLAPAVPSF
ncbi:unnamed protein product, partial [Vitis vinifera]